VNCTHANALAISQLGVVIIIVVAILIARPIKSVGLSPFASEFEFAFSQVDRFTELGCDSQGSSPDTETVCYNSKELAKVNPRSPLGGQSASAGLDSVLCIEKINRAKRVKTSPLDISLTKDDLSLGRFLSGAESTKLLHSRVILLHPFIRGVRGLDCSSSLSSLLTCYGGLFGRLL
jgi:hypothetical protein